MIVIIYWMFKCSFISLSYWYFYITIFYAFLCTFDFAAIIVRKQRGMKLFAYCHFALFRIFLLLLSSRILIVRKSLGHEKYSKSQNNRIVRFYRRVHIYQEFSYRFPGKKTRDSRKREGWGEDARQFRRVLVSVRMRSWFSRRLFAERNILRVNERRECRNKWRAIVSGY